MIICENALLVAPLGVQGILGQDGSRYSVRLHMRHEFKSCQNYRKGIEATSPVPLSNFLQSKSSLDAVYENRSTIRIGDAVEDLSLIGY